MINKELANNLIRDLKSKQDYTIYTVTIITTFQKLILKRLIQRSFSARLANKRKKTLK